MNAKKWTVVATLVVVALVGAALLVPLAFAQGPNTDQSPSFGIGQTFNGMFGRGSGMGQSGDFSSMGGRGGRMGQMGQMGQMNPGTSPMMMGRGQGQGNGAGFVDADGDGVCDNFVDANGDGVCDLAGTGRGQGTGAGFVDADGDGVCDHAQQGTQQGMMRRGGQGRMGGQSQMMGNWGQQQQQQFNQQPAPQLELIPSAPVQPAN